MSFCYLSLCYFFYIKWFSSAFSEGGKVTKYERDKGYWIGIWNENTFYYYLFILLASKNGQFCVTE